VAYTLEEIVNITGGKFLGRAAKDYSIEFLELDSRNIREPENLLFICIIGENHNGHDFIKDVYNKGVRVFLVSEDIDVDEFENASFIKVGNTVEALQQIAGAHRRKFDIPSLGITGSNGKTIIKEWLFTLLSPDIAIVKNPKSYNSQVGVPLSVWNIDFHHQFGIFEAGISEPDEMENLASVIEATIGIFTNIGPAHDAGFESRKEKIEEKLKLFTNGCTVVYCKDYKDIHEAIVNHDCNAISWSTNTIADYSVRYNKGNNETTIEIDVLESEQKLTIHAPFSDTASLENVTHCIIIMLLLDYEEAMINERVKLLKNVPMRLQLNEGENNCLIINDTYSADLLSLEKALEFMSQQDNRRNKTIIVSPFEETGMNEENFIYKLIDLCLEFEIDRFIGVGKLYQNHTSSIKNAFPKVEIYENTHALLRSLSSISFNKEVILIKGSRIYKLEEVARILELKKHKTKLEITLNHINYNLQVYRNFIKPETGIIAMVKAFSYGTGSIEIAKTLEKLNVSYLSVAFPDEGVLLRKGGINTPIITMSSDISDLDLLIEYQLEPEVFAGYQLEDLINSLTALNIQEPLNIHLKIDTGMHRLGFMPHEIDSLIETLNNQSCLRVKTIFSHLAAAEDAEHDTFTFSQIQLFKDISEKITTALDYPIKKHILNSSGIVRFTGAQFDYVRLGIGLYGVDSSSSIQERLFPVGKLKTQILQIKEVPKGASIGYGRMGTALNRTKIAILPIGYADGYDRRFSNGKGEVFIKGKKAKVIGNVCMDMTMIDVSAVDDANVGDEVEIYGPNISIINMAARIGTIPYELLTHISGRVKRVYTKE
jgi:Alr-MurF fusion protein